MDGASGERMEERMKTRRVEWSGAEGGRGAAVEWVWSSDGVLSTDGVDTGDETK